MKNNLTKEEGIVSHQYQKMVNELRALEEKYKELRKDNPKFPIIRVLENSISPASARVSRVLQLIRMINK